MKFRIEGERMGKRYDDKQENGQKTGGNGFGICSTSSNEIGFVFTQTEQ
jgi:hypothetical protein